MRAWVDGVLLESGEHPPGVSGTELPAVVPGTGDSVFTTVLVRDGRAFAWARHLRRLSGSAAALSLGALDLELVERAAREVLHGSAPSRARLRLLWGRSASGGSHLSVRLSELGAPAPSVRVITPSVRRTSGALLGGHKSTHYAENLLAGAEARRAGADEALLLNESGRLSEGTGSNVFYVVAGELRTPSLRSGCLPGIGRELVLEWCGASEVDEPAAVAQGADELFLTSSTREVQAVSEWGGRGFDVTGPVTERVRSVWAARSADAAEWFALA